MTPSCLSTGLCMLSLQQKNRAGCAPSQESSFTYACMTRNSAQLLPSRPCTLIGPHTQTSGVTDRANKSHEMWIYACNNSEMHKNSQRLIEVRLAGEVDGFVIVYNQFARQFCGTCCVHSKMTETHAWLSQPHSPTKTTSPARVLAGFEEAAVEPTEGH